MDALGTRLSERCKTSRTTVENAAIGMAHAGQLNDLAEGLISSVTNSTRQDVRFAQLKTVAVKGLRDHSYARTNQFDVKAKLDGLVEKFAVLDRDDLSDALQDRLKELPARDKFLPEALSLLMLFVQECETKALTWAELKADGPSTELGLWDDVAGGYHSSGDEIGSDDDSEPSASTSATSIDGSSALELARQYVVQPTAEEQAALQALHLIRHTSDASAKQTITELDVVRQSLQMLRAVDTNLYAVDHDGKVAVNSGLRTSTTAVSTTRDVLDKFAALGNSLGSLRRWTHVAQVNAWHRNCQAAIGGILSNFDGVLSEFEHDYVSPDRTVTVSTIEILHRTQTSAVHLCVLSQLVARAAFNTGEPYALLEGLYDLACAAQLQGNEEGFEIFSGVLLDTVGTYLRPTATWLRSNIAEDKTESFFVEESKAPCEPAEIWHSKYSLRRDAYGQLVAPNFLHNKLAEIFAMGKATMFLKQLNNDALTQNSITRDDAKDWDVMLMSSRMRNSPFTPYSHFFDDELGAWISKTGKDCAPRLNFALLHDHGVLGTLTTLSHIYLSADAVHTGSFAEALFERIERRPGTWRDAFLITELARDTIGNGSSVIHKESLTAVFDGASNGTTSVVVALESLLLQYYFTWPVQNITREKTSANHAQAFTLLLQTLYAQRCLRKPFTMLRPLSSQAQSPDSSSALKLRQALMAFCDVFHTFITTTGNVLTAEAHAQMLQATGVDDMVAVYTTYRARVERALLLGAKVKPIRDALVSILTVCVNFATFSDAAVDVERRSEDSDGKTGLQKIADMESEYKASLSFATAGVRSLSRVGGEAMLEMLADRLAWLAATTVDV
ncbi:hypothetical protein LTR95_003510 [Oleoguttula sp. CCFEE 5521]